MLKQPIALETVRRFCRKEAKTARANLLTRKGNAFDRGYWLGVAHAYELLAKYKLGRLPKVQR